MFDVPDYAELGTDGLGEIVLIHYNGPAPMKISRTVQVAWNDAMTAVSSSGEENAEYDNAIRAGFIGNAITVAFPEYVQPQYSVAGSRMSVDGSETGTLLMENISNVARQTLAMKNDAIRARAVARAAVKFVLAKAAAKAGDKLGDQVGGTAGQLISIFSKVAAPAAAAATEIADTRGWTTMPAEIRMARMAAAPGKHTVTVNYVNSAGAVIGSKVFENVSVEKGRRTYLHCRTAN